MTVRKMTLSDLKTVLGWAAAEGWNPGLEDAEAFFCADPAGFFVKEVAGQPVAAISVVNHDTANAFLGLYICHPDFRGRGFGIEVWRAGKAHAGERCIGLDGVPAQQNNYVSEGFGGHGRTIRYEGTLDHATNPDVTVASMADMSALLALDLRTTGHRRDQFLTSWLAPTETRKTFVIRRAGSIAALATCRQCLNGTKVGPLTAYNQEDMQALLAAAAPRYGAPLFIDVPEQVTALHDHLLSNGFHPVFETARMYIGEPPIAELSPFYAVATLELG